MTKPNDPKERKGRYWTPHARYQHIFVVGCYARPGRLSANIPKGQDLTLTKAFLTEEAAELEAARLNELNGEDWEYFVRIARLVPEPPGQSP